MRDLPTFHDSNLIVSHDTSDDAAVYRLNDSQALIATLDFFTPIVDDPYSFGRIAAANALSDIYAMGGTPLLAMNIVGFPNCLDMSILGEILKGGADVIKESGALLVGGHTIEDNEPKYGLSVNGIIHPDKVYSNASSKPGDILVLTKPIGAGVLNTAMKADLLDDDQINEAINVMSYLNKTAAEGMKVHSANACTDITGFGLIGHTLEMAKASNVTAVIHSSKIKLMSGAYDNAQMGIIPAGAYSNMEFYKADVAVSEGVDPVILDLIYDPQTSGGLLVSIPQEKLDNYLAFLESNLKVPFSVIGEITEKQEKNLIVK